MSSRLIWALISFTCEELSVKRSNRLVILVGVLLAVLAFVGIVVFLNQAGRTHDRPTTNGHRHRRHRGHRHRRPGDPGPGRDRARSRRTPCEQTRIARSIAADRLARHCCPSPQASRSPARRPDRWRSGQLRRAAARARREGDRLPGRPRHRPRLPDHPGDHIDIVIAQDVTPIQQTADSVAEQQNNSERRPATRPSPD